MKLSVHCIEPHTAARAARHIRRPIQVGSPPTCRPPPRCVQHHVLAAHSRAAHAHSLARSTRAGCNPVRHTPTRRMPTQRCESGPAVAIMRAGMNWRSLNSGPRRARVVRTTAPARERRHALAEMRSELVSLSQTRRRTARRPRQHRQRRDDARSSTAADAAAATWRRPAAYSQRCQVSPPLGPPLSDVQCRCQKWQAHARGWLSCPRERRTRTWRLPSRKCPRSCSIVARMPPTRMSAFARPWMCDGLPSHHTFCAARSISATLATSSTTAGGSMVNRGSSVDWRGRSYKTRKFGK